MNGRRMVGSKVVVKPCIGKVGCGVVSPRIGKVECSEV